MSVLWLAVMVVGVSPGEATGGPADAKAAVEQPAQTPRQGVELGKAVDEALRRWAKTSDADAPKAARELLALFGELKADQKTARPTREARITRVRARLSRLADQIRKTDDAKAATVKNGAEPRVLGQFGGGMAGGMGGGFGVQGGRGGQGFGGNAAAVPDDNGEDLAEVIQTTIAPSTWERNGGYGSIYYWRPGRALVIRQTDEVHGQLVDLMEQLERANH